MGAGTILIAGTVISAYGTYAGLRAAEVQAKHQAQINRNNALIAKERIKDVITLGKKGERQLERETVQFGADQVTSFASAGIDISSAVVQERLGETARTGAADIIKLQGNVLKDVWGLEVGIQSDLAQAQLEESKAKSAKKLAPIAAGATLLSGFGSLAIRRTDSTNPLERGGAS